MTNQPLTQDQQEELLDRLIGLTQKRALQWRDISDAPADFMTPAKPMAYRIASLDDDGFAPFSLYVYKSPERAPILSLDTDPENPTVASRLEQLYSLVQRQVRGWDGLAEEIFESLDRIEKDAPPF